LRREKQNSIIPLDFPDGATVANLQARLQSMGIDLESEETIISLSGRGLCQWSPDRVLEDGEELAVFPHIAGG
jgi:molybdopterin converting factor small subunit